MGVWSARLVFHIPDDHFFLQYCLILVLGLCCVYLIHSFRENGWLLRHLTCPCILRLVGPFTFLESWCFLSKQHWTHTLIIVPRGTQPHAFVVSEQNSVGSKIINYSFIVILLVRMIILLQTDNYFLLLVHYLIVIFFFLYISLVLLNIYYIYTLDGNDAVCTCIVTVYHILDGLWWLHTFASSLLCSEFIECLSKLASYIQLHGGHIKFIGETFYVHTCDTRRGATTANFSEWTVFPRYVYSINEIYINGLYDMFVNGLDVQSIHVCFVKYVVCTNCSSMIWKDCPSTLILDMSENPWT